MYAIRSYYAINSQTATGNSSGTVIPEGIKWGRNVLTPEAPYDQGGSEDDYRKIMIVLTDGDTEDGECVITSYSIHYTKLYDHAVNVAAIEPRENSLSERMLLHVELLLFVPLMLNPLFRSIAVFL